MVVNAWLEGTMWWEVTAWLEVTVSVDATVLVVNVEAMEFARLGALRNFAVATPSAESDNAFTGFGRPCLGDGNGGRSIADEVTPMSESSLSFDFLLVSQKWPEDFPEWT